MSFIKRNRAAGFFVITIIYVIALIIGIWIFQSLTALHIFWRVLAGDTAATVFVYLTGVILKNASVYDPYWSVAPVVVFTGIAADSGRLEPGVLLLLLAVWFWGLRLTSNWAYTFKNLFTQDWRYDRFKTKYPRIFQIISFLGINMFPTLVVYLCMLPGIVFIQKSVLNGLTVFGFALCVFAATLQLIADIQMHRFRRVNAGNGLIIRDGLWKHSRHPNYLGEILMWWGVYIMMLSNLPAMWIFGIGPMVNTLMFLFISIPLADKRNRGERINFDAYVRETNSLLPIRIKASPVEEISDF